MFSLLKQMQQPLLAVDVSSESLRLLEAKSRKQHIVIENAVKILIPPGIIVHQRLVNPPAFKEILQKALLECTPSQKNAILALSVNQAMIKKVTFETPLLAKNSSQLIKQYILTETPAHVEDIFWDCAITDKSKTPSAEYEIVISQRAPLLTYLQLFAECGLTLRMVELESYSLVRAWTYLYPQAASEPIAHALLWMNADLLTLVIVYQSQLLYARAWPLDPSEDYETALLKQLPSLWRCIPWSTDWPSVSQIWLAGKYATTAHTIVEECYPHMSVKIACLQENRHIHVATSTNLAGFFLAFGLSIRGIGHDH